MGSAVTDWQASAADETSASTDSLSTSSGSQQLHRGLRARHLNMIAIGGAIGTGLFVASGGTISQAGPGGALVAYALIGIMVFFLMQSLGEMAAYMPVAGSFGEYGTRFVSPSFGFAMGWNYWFNWAITVAAELVAAGLVMKFWLPDVPMWIWSAIFLVILFTINALSARAYGEGEFWFALIKVITVIVFLVVGVLMIVGILGGTSPGFSNWVVADPHNGTQAPFVGGALGILAVFMIAGFSFQGTELIGVAAGEAENPSVSIPKAIKSVFWRILLFYILAIAVIGFLIPYTDPNLLNASDTGDITIAPFTLIFAKSGLVGQAVIASVMNAVILTAVLSAGNSGLYASTRMLYALAENHQAPHIFAKLNNRGVPMTALVGTTVIALLCFLSYVFGEDSAYTWIVNASGLAGFITWVGIAWCHLKFRKAYTTQGHDLAELPFRAKLYPAGPIIALVMCVLVIIGQNTEALLGRSDFLQLLSSYIGLPLFLLLWAGHKLITRSPKIDPAKADLSVHEANKA
ncbi:MAG: amino acid permease [Arcanobacterium sp.]|nr:amino acid permease [Arcanobacterium sp.]MDY5588758.1 amino acid permease [Arcanobacterium sp.]